MPHTFTLNWIDWVTLAIVLVSVLRGARFGAPAGLLDLAALIATFLTATLYYPLGAGYLSGIPVLSPSWQSFVAFLLMWMGLYLPLGMLIRWALSRATFPASGLIGGVLGIARGLVLAAALLVLMLAAPFRSVIAADAHHSQVAPYLLQGNARFQRLLLTKLPIGMRVPRIGPGGTMF
jgi:uncharacterized membrane protein required for colicin V production